jgi:hypothetical protein
MSEINKTLYYGGTFSGYNLLELDKERQKTREKLNSHGFKVLDPMRGGKNLNALAETANEFFSPNEIVHRDLRDIDRSEIVLLEMKKASIGSSCELMYSSLNKKIIIIISEEPSVINHFWVQSLATKILPDIDSTIDHLITFYGE